MFKFFFFAAVVAVCAAKPGVVAPLAYSAYPGVAAYPALSAYSALPTAYSGVYPGVSAYAAHPAAYSAYAAHPAAYSAYSAHPAAYSAYPAVSTYSAYSSPLVKSVVGAPLAYTAGVPLGYSGLKYV